MILKPATRWALLTALVVFIVAVSIGLSLYLSASAVNQAQHNWCDTLTLLTSHAVPKPSNPSANPSRYDDWLFYHDLVVLKQRFGC